MAMEQTARLTGFSALTPDVVIDLIEKSLGQRCTNLCRPLNSYINRVFELKLENGDGIIAKFYRPGRWNRTALLDEHEFLTELAELEIPVIPPLPFADGATLHEQDGMYFTAFQKKLGRSCDEPTDNQWEELGRLLARVHAVGAIHPPRNRITMTPGRSTHANLDFILRSGVLPRDQRGQYERAVHDTIQQIDPMFDECELIRIHGDCHRANIVYRPDESFYLIDFDDMAVGPPIQDLWMLLPGHKSESLVEIDFFMEGYETFRSFDRRTLRLIEPLRAMRYIHFTAWCAAQVADGGFARLSPGWGTESFWKGEIRDLRNQQEEIAGERDPLWG
ncbi:MAG: serine/threonine protein kinase [Bacteroidota bacterium]